MNWTPEQELAISLRNRRLLVSAAAGSGKTAVLTGRIIDRITSGEDPADIDSLLVMTFTKAAAAEMRERIRRAVETRLSECAAAGGQEYERLKRQAALIDGARITTIDSFCLSVIREHADLTDLDPSFRVGGEDELSLMRADCLTEVLEEAFEEGGEEFERFAASYTTGRDDSGLADLAASVYRFSESTPWPEEWLEEQLKEAETAEAGTADPFRAPWTETLLVELRDYFAGLAQRADAMLAVCDESGGPAGYAGTIEEERERFRMLSEARDFQRMRSILLTFREWAKIGRKGKTDDAGKVKLVQDTRNAWKRTMGSMIERFGGSREEVLDELKNEARAVRVLTGLVRAFRARYTERKRDRNLLDFSDLEHLALELFWTRDPEGNRVRTPVAEEYRRMFREIYIDEYQDSNDVQEQLLLAMDKGSVFMVGDVKQSIYAFRQAKPELFNRKYHTFRKAAPGTGNSGKAASGADGSGADGSGAFAAQVPEGTDTRVDLSRNFRSRQEVVDAVNGIFRVIMRPETGGIGYGEDAFLRCGADYPEPEQGKESMFEPELLLADTDGFTGDADSQEIEARMIADRIRRLTDPASGISVYDSEMKKMRPVRFGDIVILLRALRNRAETLVSVLMSEGIPAKADQSTGYFDAQEVRMVLSILEAVDNPLSDIPFAAFLVSPVTGLTNEELALLTAEAGRGEDPEPLYTRLSRVKDSQDHPEAAEKLRNAFSLLEAYSARAVTVSLPDLVRGIMDESGLYAYVSALPGGNVRRANLDMLYEKARAFEAAGYRGLYDFVRYIALLKKYDTDFGEASPAGESGDTVRVMTIHRSKGLEFPVVFVAGLTKQFNMRDTGGGIIVDQRLGIAADNVDLALHTKDSTMKKNAVAWHMRTEALGEELRVLYVAMTRAKEKLILTAAKSGLSAKAAKGTVVTGTADLRSALSYLDWILPALNMDPGRCGFRTEFFRAAEEAEKQEAVFRGTAKLEEALSALVHAPSGEVPEAFRYMDLPYPYEADTMLHTKLSVSELKHRGDHEDLMDAAVAVFVPEEQEDPAFPAAGEDAADAGERPADTAADSAKAREEKRRAASERGMGRGTVYHRVMELLDYGRVSDTLSLSAFLKELADREVLTEEERAVVRPGDFRSFFGSELGKRMRAAAGAGELRREAPFVMAVPASRVDPGTGSEEPVLVQGIIDAWFPDEDGSIVLVDYKTDRVKTEEELKERYRVQLDYYAEALSMMEAKRVSEKIIWSFALGRAISL